MPHMSGAPGFGCLQRRELIAARLSRKPGDTIEVEITGVGILRNPIIAEDCARKASGWLHFVRWRVPKVGLDRSVGLHGQGITSAIERFADRNSNPSLADAIFLDVGPFDALEPDAHAPTQDGLVVKRTSGIVG
jgi:hypothetical protein